MKSIWEVEHSGAFGRPEYRVYRVKDIEAEDEPTNREYDVHVFRECAIAQQRANELNAKENVGYHNPKNGWIYFVGATLGGKTYRVMYSKTGVTSHAVRTLPVRENAYLAGVDLAGFALRNKLEKVVLE